MDPVDISSGANVVAPSDFKKKELKIEYWHMAK